MRRNSFLGQVLTAVSRSTPATGPVQEAPADTRATRPASQLLMAIARSTPAFTPGSGRTLGTRLQTAGPARRRSYRQALSLAFAASSVPVIAGSIALIEGLLSPQALPVALSSNATPTPAAAAPAIVGAINQQITGPLPAGYAVYSRLAGPREVAGFSVAAPASWKVTTSGFQTYLRDPSAANVSLLVDLTPHTYMNNMLKEAAYIRAQAAPHFPGYKQLELSLVTIRGSPGAYWNFTWNDAGVRQEAADLLWVARTSAGRQSYALYMTAPVSMWNQMQPVFEVAMRTFSPLPG